MVSNQFFVKKGPFPLKDIIKAIGYNGNFSSKDEFKVHSFESLVNATNKDMTFLNSHKYQNLSLKTKAAACITSSNLSKFLPESCIKIDVKNVLFAVTQVARMFYPTAELDLYTIAIKWKRNILKERIQHRTDLMLEQGWIEEVEILLSQQDRDKRFFPALNSIGYRQIQSYLNKKINYEEMREEIIIKTRQLAKRQVKWFSKEPIDLTLEMDNLGNQNISQILYCLFQVII